MNTSPATLSKYIIGGVTYTVKSVTKAEATQSAKAIVAKLILKESVREH